MILPHSASRLAVAVWVVFAMPSQAQVPSVPTPAGDERVVFRNTLTPLETQFNAAAPPLQIYRHDLFDAVQSGKLYWGEADLDGDGKPERILVDERSGNCGTAGCNGLVLTGPQKRWRIVGEIAAIERYFVVLSASDFGWRRLQSAGGEISWRGCGYHGGGTPEEEAFWPPDPCPRIHYGEGLLAKEKKRTVK
jgi:hypothetical protein